MRRSTARSGIVGASRRDGAEGGRNVAGSSPDAGEKTRRAPLPTSHLRLSVESARGRRRRPPGPLRRVSISEILRSARSGFTRLSAVDAARLLAEGRLVLVDTRPIGQRAADGEIPGAVVIDRNVLEWRLDPASPSRLPIARYGLPVAVLCNQGYSSTLAAASLRALGLSRATDVVGGFQAWRAAGLPIVGHSPDAASDNPSGADAPPGTAGPGA